MTEPIQTKDAFSNPVARLGYGTQNLLEATEYPMARLTQNYALLGSLYRNNWIVQNIISMIPEDMVKKGFSATGSITPEMTAQFKKMVQKTKLQGSLLEGLKWGRLYGGAIGVILIQGQEGSLDKPLDLDRVLPGSFAGLYIIDRWSGLSAGSGLVSDMNDADFGLPEYYEIQGGLGMKGLRIHHSRAVRFLGRELPYIEKVNESYWGQSELESIYEELVKRDNVSHNMASLVFKANVSYLESDSLDQMLALSSPESQRQFWQTLQAQSVLESNFGMRIVNKGDALHNIQYGFSGLPEVYDAIMMDVAGASRIPVTKLFGRSPAGLNATGESDLQNYYDFIDELRQTALRPILERLLPVLALSTWGKIPGDLEIGFDPLWTPKATDLADIAQKKTAAILSAFQAGLLDVSAAQQELKALSKTTGMYESITDEVIQQNKGLTYQDVTSMRDPLAGLSGTPGDDEVD